MVLAMAPEMLGELVDPRREQRDLDLGRPGVPIRAPVLGDDLLLLLGSKAHVRRKTVAGNRYRSGPTDTRSGRSSGAGSSGSARAVAAPLVGGGRRGSRTPAVASSSSPNGYGY